MYVVFYYQISGYGVAKSSTGSYEGHWKKGKYHGEGTSRRPDGSPIYFGGFELGKRHGQVNYSLISIDLNYFYRSYYYLPSSLLQLGRIV